MQWKYTAKALSYKSVSNGSLIRVPRLRTARKGTVLAVKEWEHQAEALF